MIGRMKEQKRVCRTLGTAVAYLNSMQAFALAIVTYLTGEPVAFAKTTSNLTHLVIPQRKRAKKPLNGESIQLAVQAIKLDVTLSQKHAAKTYRVPQKTLSDRLAGASP
jgi:hypothetical protein